MNTLLKIFPYLLIKILTLNNNQIIRKSIFLDIFYPFTSFPSSSISHIVDNIYIGNIYDSADIKNIKNLRIGYIVNISLIIPNFYYNQIKYLNINIQDNGIEKYSNSDFNKINKFIQLSQKKKKNILIHCFNGQSRSVIPVIKYLMDKYDFCLTDAIFYIKNKRSIINPSLVFLNNLN